MSGVEHNAVLQNERRGTSGGSFPVTKLAGSCQGLHVPGGRRHFHACAVYASAAKEDGQPCILKTVDDMIHYCNMCRSKGSYVEAMRILETAHQVASQGSSHSRNEALGRIQLAIAAVHWDRCDYDAAVEALRVALDQFTLSLDAMDHFEVCTLAHEVLGIFLLMMHQIDAATYPLNLRCAMLESPGPLPDFMLEAEKSIKPSEMDPKGLDENIWGSPEPELTAAPFLEPREWNLSARLLKTGMDMQAAEKEPVGTRRKAWEDAVDVLGTLLKDATAISGDDHPRVAVVFAVLGHAYAKFAQVAGGGQELLAEASFRKALKTLDTPRVSSLYGAYSTLVNLTKARLAAVLRKDPRRINEADQLASEVEDKRMLDDNHNKYLLVSGVHGIILAIPDATGRLPGMPK